MKGRVSGVRFPAFVFMVILMLWSFAWVRADRTAESSEQEKFSPTIGLRASGRGAPQVTLQDAVEAATERGERGEGGGEYSPLTPTVLAQGDINGDGIPDLVVGSAQGGGGELAVWLGRGQGEFLAPLRVRLAGETPSALVVEDVTGDGRADAIVGYSDATTLAIYAGGDNGSLVLKTTVDLGLTVTGLAWADVTGDGVGDLLVATDSPLLALVPGVGGGRFGQAQFISLALDARLLQLGPVQVADLDNDGLLDVCVIYRGQTSGLAILYGRTAGGVTPPWYIPTSTPPEAVVLADINGDHRLDLVASERATGHLVVFTGRAGRQFSGPTYLAAGIEPAALTKANFNGDGLPDLAVVDSRSNQVILLLAGGDGSFRSPIALDVQGQPVAITAGRFNADGLDDLAVAKIGGANVVVSLTAPPTIVVTTAADGIAQDGKVTLREAILAANGNPPNSDVPSGRGGGAPDVIGFDIPDAEKTGDRFILRLRSDLGGLPPLTDGGTTLDGSTQKGYAGTPIIVLDGSQLAAVDGITITSSLNVLRGLVITGFGGNGVKISGSDTPVTGNIIAGCSIGIDPTTPAARGNALAGIALSGRAVENTVIGGAVAADRNLIAGNGSHGIEIGVGVRQTQVINNIIGAVGRRGNQGDGISITGADNTIIGGSGGRAGNLIVGNGRNGLSVEQSAGTRVQRNRIGVIPGGGDRAGNGGDGILLVAARNSVIGGPDPAAGNVISGNGGNGITLVRSALTRIQGNLIGTDENGRVAVGNSGVGVLLDEGSQNNTLGGEDEGAGNVISGNGGAGVLISRDTQGTLIAGNIIGLDAGGRAALGNGGDGVTISGGGNNQIGGSSRAARNLISANAGDGIKILDSSSNRVTFNIIGLDGAGDQARPNGGNGVLILTTDGRAAQNLVQNNVIAHNRGAGVKILSSGFGNQVSRNAIFGNEGLGIDRGGQGVLPRITAVTNNGGGSVTVSGVFPAPAAEGATIEAFLADPDPSGRGEGRTFLGSAKADARGNFSLTVVGRSDGEWITVTATDFRGDTSEFSPNVIVDLIAPTVRVVLPNGGEAIRSGTTFCISWTASDNVGVVATEVLLSTDSGATFSHIGATSVADQRFCWNVPRDLVAPQARIRVVAQDAAGNRGQDDSDADFAIDPNAPVVTVLIPNGGEILPGSSRFRILWSALGTIASCDVLLSTDSGASYTLVATNLPGTQSSYLWMPGTISTRQGRIRVVCTDTQNRRAVDDSDADFTVDSTPPRVTVLTPNGGEIIRAGSRFRIQWQSSDDLQVASHDLLLSLDGLQSFGPLPDAAGQKTSGLPGDQQFFDWEVPFDLQTTQGRICVRARDVAGNELQDCNDANFTIVQVPPSVRVLSPNGGEILTGGSRVTIRWTASDRIVEQEILLSLDGGASFPLTIASGLSGSVQSFDWTVPATLSTRRGRIRVIAQNAAGRLATDDSDGDFIIDSRPPTVRVISPNGREVFRGGDVFTILWRASDDVELVRQTVQISTDGGTTFSDIVTLDGSDPQRFDWRVPLTLFTLRGRVRVVVQDVAGNIVSDDSDADFWTIPFENEPPFIRVTAPNGGEIVCAGRSFTIQWQSSDNTAVQWADILLSLDGGTSFTPIVERLPGTVQSFEWNVPAGLSSTRAVILIRVRDYAGNVASDVSDRLFAIDGQNPVVTSVTIGPGNAFLARQSVTIAWDAADDVGITAQTIEFSADGGATWTKLADVAASARSFVWTIPAGTRTTDGRVRVTARDACGRTGQDVSNRFWIISSF
jgi:hypothetical protein